MSLIDKMKKLSALVLVTSFAATVMPTASFAEDDAPSGDFTVNVYADLEEFGDPCEGGFGGGSSLAISVSSANFSEASPGEPTEITLDQNQGGVQIETYPGGEQAINLENLLALHFIEDTSSIPDWQSYGDGTASYDNQFQDLSWDLPLPADGPPIYGDINDVEINAYGYELSLPRQTIYAPWHNVHYDADSCEGSDLVGVLTVSRSDVMYEAPSQQPISVEADWELGFVLDTSHNETGFFGTGKLISFTDLYGSPSVMPLYPANLPGEGQQVTSVGFQGQQGYGTKVDVFGASPAGGYYMEVNHRLYVDSVQYSTWILEFLSD